MYHGHRTRDEEAPLTTSNSEPFTKDVHFQQKIIARDQAPPSAHVCFGAAEGMQRGPILALMP